MSITSDLEQILSARYGKDVRQAIHDSIEEGYNIAVQAQGIAETSQESAKAYAQAALASEQAAEDYKTAAEQAAEQAMSGTPEGYADLVAKVNSIYRQTATSYNVVGTSEGSALAHTIYGMSEQDGTPTPDNPVDIVSAEANFKCRGKNLIDADLSNRSSNGLTCIANGDGTYTINGTASADTRFYLYTSIYKNVAHFLQKGKKYRLTDGLNNTSNNTYNIQFGIFKNRVFVGWAVGTANGLSVFKLPSETEYDYNQIAVYIAVNEGQTLNNVVFKPMITVWGDSEEYQPDQTYEPYQHTDVTTDLTLRAIEVTSSDDYNLERDGKYYIADTVDWSEDEGYKLIRRIGKRDITTMQDIGSQAKYGIVSVNLFNPSDFILRKNTDTKQDALMSNRFKIERFYNYISSAIDVMSYNADIERLYLRNSEITSLNEWNEWLSNNPVEVYGVLKTPTTEPITSEQAQALLSLKTYDGATSIMAESNIEPIMELEYSKDRNTALSLTGHNLAHKNALKLNDINTVLIELGGN